MDFVEIYLSFDLGNVGWLISYLGCKLSYLGFIISKMNRKEIGLNLNIKRYICCR